MAVTVYKPKSYLGKIRVRISEVKRAVKGLDKEYRAASGINITGFFHLVGTIENSLEVIGFEIDRELEIAKRG